MADFPSQEEPKLPPIFQAGRAFRSWSSFAALQESIQRGGSNTWVESATVIQPQGIWVEIRVRTQSTGGIFGPADASYWVNTTSGAVYG